MPGLHVGLLLTTPLVFGRRELQLKFPPMGRGAVGLEVAGRGFAANARTTTCVLNFGNTPAWGKIVRETPTSSFPEEGIARPNALFPPLIVC